MTTIESNLLEVSIASVKEDQEQVETIYDVVSSTIVSPADATTRDQMNLVEASGVLDFWHDPEEDIYDETDGNAV